MKSLLAFFVALPFLSATPIPMNVAYDPINGAFLPNTLVNSRGSVTGSTSNANVGTAAFDLVLSLNSTFVPHTDALAFCVELLQSFGAAADVPAAFTSYRLDEAPNAHAGGAPFTETQQYKLRALWTTAITLATTQGPNIGMYSAAFQWIVWDIVADGGAPIDFTSGTVRWNATTNAFTLSVRNQANAWIQIIESGTVQLGPHQLHILVSDTKQNLIYQLDTPEPDTILLLGTALVFFGLWGRVRRRRS